MTITITSLQCAFLAPSPTDGFSAVPSFYPSRFVVRMTQPLSHMHIFATISRALLGPQLPNRRVHVHTPSTPSIMHLAQSLLSIFPATIRPRTRFRVSFVLVTDFSIPVFFSAATSVVVGATEPNNLLRFVTIVE